MKGKLITIEANDGAGKETQSKLLYKKLKEDGHKVMMVSFPNYEGKGSELVKMYLSGEFGKRADDVDPYAASVFFAVDRYASYKTDWKEKYDNGWIIIADRYTTSNMVHQSTKFDSETDMAKFLYWLRDFEFNKMGLPKPDLTVYLDVPSERSLEVIASRNNKINGSDVKDIHESDASHITRAHDIASRIADIYDWVVVECFKNGQMESVEAINNQIYSEVVNNLRLIQNDMMVDLENTSNQDIIVKGSTFGVSGNDQFIKDSEDLHEFLKLNHIFFEEITLKKRLKYCPDFGILINAEESEIIGFGLFTQKGITYKVPLIPSFYAYPGTYADYDFSKVEKF